MTYNELAIKWGEPEINDGTGRWWTQAENLTERTKQLLAAQPMCSFIAEDKREAKIWFDRTWVAMYGAHRCWWMLREEVVESPVLLSLTLQIAMDDALNTDDPYDDGDDDLGGMWGRLGLVN